MADLHDIAQLAMGWSNSHLHQFRSGWVRYAPPNPEEEFYDSLPASDSSSIRLFESLPQPGSELVYEYDFGDSWEHSVQVLGIRPALDGEDRPRCAAGAGACPPEDCGGAGGYERFLEAIGDPEHPEHDEMVEWCGGAFDPASFDLAETDGLLAKYAKKRAAWLKRTDGSIPGGRARQDARIEHLAGILEARDRARARRARAITRERSTGWVLNTKG